MTKDDKKILETISLEGKIAVITGAASGIGLATSEVLAEAGATIAILDINDDNGKQAEKKIIAAGGKAKYYRCNVTIDAECEKTVEEIIKDYKKIDILFNNAGVTFRKNVLDLTETEWDLVIDVSLKSIFLMSRYVVPHMIKNKSGNIVNTGSGWALFGGENAVAYCAAKGGVLNMTKAMAIDHGKDGIRVNCICPGDVDTPLLRGEATQLGQDEEEFMKEAADRPLKRVGLPRDIAQAVLFLVSDQSSWMTGSHILVDGGGYAG
ncbi:MAG: SDR family NAD(P)-dependent oxidoreductase [Candidatus Heimdallarchaeota archaeon]